VWYPTIQFTFKIFNPKTGDKLWKSVNVTNFVTPPPGLDKHSSKSDQYSITYKTNPGSDTPESYSIRANLDNEVQISLEFVRSASIPGFKIGKGPKGGFSYFGTDQAKPDGYVVHRFWPRVNVKGIIVAKGKALSVNGPGMFVNAIQGMRPNLVASRWNFGYFQSDEHGGVSAILMDFVTTDDYGKAGSGSGFVTTSVGTVVVGGKLAAVTAETKWGGEAYPEDSTIISRALHLNPQLDPDTSYAAPTGLTFRLAGPSIVADAPGTVDATLTVDLGNPQAYKGLVEKVDVLAEIPYVIKTVVNYVAGTKPYIYQWQNPASIVITGPDAILPGLSEGITVEGQLYHESSFIS